MSTELFKKLRSAMDVGGMLSEPINVARVHATALELLRLLPKLETDVVTAFVDAAAELVVVPEPGVARPSPKDIAFAVCVAAAAVEVVFHDDEGAHLNSILERVMCPHLEDHAWCLVYLAAELCKSHPEPCLAKLIPHVLANLTQVSAATLAADLLDGLDDAQRRRVADGVFTPIVELLSAPLGGATPVVPDATFCNLLHRVVSPCVKILGADSVRRFWDLVVTLHDHGQARRLEAVTALCACFDVVLPSSNGTTESALGVDVRRTDFLWNICVAAMTTHPQDSEVQISVEQKRAVYLLKRVVDYTDREGHTESVTFSTKCFHWDPSGSSRKMWDLFFTLFETLSEYGTHIVQPVLREAEKLLPGGLELVWVYCLYEKAMAHCNVAVKKMALLAFFQSGQLDRFLLDFPIEFTCAAVLRSLNEVKLYTDNDRVLFDTYWSCRSGGREAGSMGGTLHPFILTSAEYAARLAKARLGVSTTAAQELLHTAVCVMSETSTSRCGLAAMLRVLLIAVEAMRVSDAEGCFFDKRTIVKMHDLIAQCVNDHFPRWLEIRYDACLFDIILCALGPKWVETIQVADVAACLGVLSHAGSSGGKGICSVDVSGTVGTPGATLTPYAITALGSKGRTTWSAATKTAVAAYIVEASSKFVQSSEPMSETFVHAEYRTFLALLPCVVAADGAESDVLVSIKAKALAGLEDMGAHTYTPLSVKVRRLLLLQELLFLFHANPSVRNALLDKHIARDLLSFCLSQLRDALRGGVEDPAAANENVSWQMHNFAHTDAFLGAIFSIMHHDHAEIAPRAKEILELCADSVSMWVPLFTSKANAVHQHNLIVLARNALRIVHTFMTLNIVCGSDAVLSLWSGESKSRLLQSLVTLPELRLEAGDRPCPFTNETWSVVLSQYARYAMNSIAILLDDTSAGSSVRQFAPDLVAKCAHYAVERLGTTSHHNMSAVLDIVALSVEHLSAAADAQGQSPEELLLFVHKMVGELDGREMFRTVALLSNIAFQDSLLDDVQNDNAEVTIRVVNHLLEKSGGCQRTRYFVATALCGAINRNPSKRWPVLSELVYRLAIKTNTTKFDGEADIAMSVMEPHVTRFWPTLSKQEVLGPQLDVVTRTMCVCTILSVCRGSDDTTLDVVTHLLDMNLSDVALSHEPCMPNSDFHRNRLRCWQILCGLLPCITEPMIPAITDVVKKVMLMNNLSSTRRYMDVFMLDLAIRFQSMGPFLVAGMTDFSLRPQVVGSYACIVSHALLYAANETWAWNTFVPTLLMHANHFNYMMRLSSQIALFHAYTAFKKKEKFTGVTVPDEVLAVFTFIEKQPECAKWRKKHSSNLLYEPSVVTQLRNLFCIQRREGEFWLLDSVPPSAFGSLLNVERELASALGSHTPVEMWRSRRILARTSESNFASLVPSGFDSESARFVTVPLSDTWSTMAAAAAEHAEKYNGEDNGGAQQPADGEGIQRKVTPWWNSEFHNELTTQAALSQRRHDVIVVASYVQNAINVAALCRCCEIFGVETLAVPTTRFFSAPEFVATARSAEQWVPIKEVPEPDVISYIESKRREGYAIVGVEQTSNSVPLENCTLPMRTVFILGAEGHGLPVQTIQRCDMCVEIAQFGVVRSLNVHVSCAIVLHEYIRQNVPTGAGIMNKNA